MMKTLRSILRNNKCIYYWYKKIQYNHKIRSKYIFKDRSKSRKKLCIVLAGYKSFLYESVFERLDTYMENDIDVCIVTSGKFDEEVDAICQKNDWSYLSTKENNVSLVQNLAIDLHKSAEYIFKLDEDIFITRDYFKKMYLAYRDVEENGNYNIGFMAPLIPINGYGHMRILQKLGKIDEYKKLFEKPIFAAGPCRMIESNPEVAKFFWGEGGYIPSIDWLNNKFEKEEFYYSACPIRFSIGAILFSRKTFMDMGMFSVNRNGNSMGRDEEDFCTFCISNSKAIIVAENVVVGHLAFGKQNMSMKEYYMKNKERFKINEKSNPSSVGRMK